MKDWGWNVLRDGEQFKLITASEDEQFRFFQSTQIMDADGEVLYEGPVLRIVNRVNGKVDA